MKTLIHKLYTEHELSYGEFHELLQNRSEEDQEYLFELARKTREETYGNKVFLRTLVEFTNYCKNDCYYCGIRRSNTKAVRYRLTQEEIEMAALEGVSKGCHTVVLQGGEDPYFTDDRICQIVKGLKARLGDICAVTLSIGERPMDSYRKFRKAGVDRYLLRHETADEEHYRILHPRELSLAARKECLYNLKKLGFQTGAGFMVGSPGQTVQSLVQDLLFLKELKPEMVGIGPFISHKDTPFAKEKNGSLEDTLFLLGVIRLLLPTVLLPATTALGTIAEDGIQRGLQAGANVIMPNFTPSRERKKYTLYDNKNSIRCDTGETMEWLKSTIEKAGCQMDTQSRGDFQGKTP